VEKQEFMLQEVCDLRGIDNDGYCPR